MITLTPAAAEQVRVAALRSSAQGLPLRVAAKVADDGSLVFGMGFDEQREQDVVVEAAGVEILVSPPSQELLAGAILDFAEVRPGEFGFVVATGGEAETAPSGGGCGGSCRCGGR